MSNLPHLAAPLGVLESSPDCSSSVPGGSASSSVSDQLPLLKPVGKWCRDLLPAGSCSQHCGMNGAPHPPELSINCAGDVCRQAA